MSIDLRPDCTNRSEEFSHWEGYSIVGMHQNGFHSRPHELDDPASLMMVRNLDDFNLRPREEGDPDAIGIDNL